MIKSEDMAKNDNFMIEIPKEVYLCRDFEVDTLLQGAIRAYDIWDYKIEGRECDKYVLADTDTDEQNAIYLHTSFDEMGRRWRAFYFTRQSEEDKVYTMVKKQKQ